MLFSILFQPNSKLILSLHFLFFIVCLFICCGIDRAEQRFLGDFPEQFQVGNSANSSTRQTENVCSSNANNNSAIFGGCLQIENFSPISSCIRLHFSDGQELSNSHQSNIFINRVQDHSRDTAIVTSISNVKRTVVIARVSCFTDCSRGVWGNSSEIHNWSLRRNFPSNRFQICSSSSARGQTTVFCHFSKISKFQMTSNQLKCNNT